MFLSVQPVEDDLNAHKLQMKFPNDQNKKVTKVYVLLMALSVTVVVQIPCIPNAAFTNTKQNVMQIHCTSNQSLEHHGRQLT
jgi:hypothetical protein